MRTVVRVALGTFLGIALAYAAYKMGNYVVSSVKRQREEDAAQWMGNITPSMLVKACGKPARDVTSDFGPDLPVVYREMYYPGGAAELTWCFRFTRPRDDTDHVGWEIDSFYRGPARSDLKNVSTVTVGGTLDPDENPGLFDAIRPGKMGPDLRDGMIAVMPCLSAVE